MARIVIDTSNIEADIARLVERLPAPYQDADNLISLMTDLFNRCGCDFAIVSSFTAPETGDHILRFGLARNIKVEALAYAALKEYFLRAELN